MRILRARVTNYRSIRDTGWFDVEPLKTILVGPNEAGKTAVLRALQTIKPPGDDGSELDPLRDYPRSLYSRIQRGQVDPKTETIAQAEYEIDDDLRAKLAETDVALAEVDAVRVGRVLDNSRWVEFVGFNQTTPWKDIRPDAARLRAHIEKQGAPGGVLAEYDTAAAALETNSEVTPEVASRLRQWVDHAEAHASETWAKTIEKVRSAAERPGRVQKARKSVIDALPTFVYYSTYFGVRPRIHLSQLAERIRTGTLDEEYDFGNLCLLKLLGFDAAQLAAQGRVPDPMDEEATPTVQAQLDERQYALNAAEVDLNAAIRRVWGEEDLTLRFRVDGDYLKVVVQDDLGVEVELDQRSAGFVWLVSFYVVFKAEAMDNLANAILLLDEPGLSLHALKQQEFRKTVSLLAQDNQTIYTTHSPFMVGPDELNLVRVVEMKDRETGTKVHIGVLADDPRSLFPLQEALGYNMAQSLFAQEKNLVCEGLTDLWYLEGVSGALAAAGKTGLDSKIAVVPAGDAGKVVYYGTILHSQALKVAALLDSDQAGDRAAMQDDFARLLPKKRLHRPKDHYNGPVTRVETEDLLRDTLVQVAKNELGWDVEGTAAGQPARPVVDIFAAEIAGFSKYKLAKAFLKWAGAHDLADLSSGEVSQWESLITAINKSLD